MNRPAHLIPSVAGPVGGRTPPRWLTGVVVFLLITVPAVYLVISGVQSREGSAPARAEASATGLRWNWPPRMDRRIYRVPVPPRSAGVAYYETNAWKTSSLYVRFVTSASGLDRFLNQVGTDRASLDQGAVTITHKQGDTVGWRFHRDQDWAGLVVRQKKPKPDLRITVSFAQPQHPRVYVVSTVTP